MTARALGGIVRSNVSDRKVFNFAGCDLAVPAPAIFSGGGNRVRRRIHGAVGPERTNQQPYSEKLDEAAHWMGNPAVAVAAESDRESPFWTLTKTDPAGSEAFYTPGITPESFVWTLEVSILATASSSVCDVGIYQVSTGFGADDNTSFAVVGGPGSATRNTGALITVSGLSLTVPTIVKLTRTLTTLAHVMGPILYPGGHASATVGHATKFTRVHLGEGIELGPYIKTLGAPVTTTDWPRRTLNGNGTTPQYGDGGWWATDGTADLLPSNVLGPTGHPMSKLARRATGVTDGCYAYQGNLTFIAGEKYARRIVAQAGDNVGDLVFVELATSPGVYIANGTINVRTGEVPTVNNGTIVLMGRIGRQFIFELRGTAPASVATGYCSWIIPFAGALGTGHYFGCDQTEHGEVCTAHMHSGLGQYGSAVTPPFGQLVDVDAGKPRIEYGADGFGRGIKIATEATNNVGNSTNFLAWTPYSGGVGTYKELWDPVWGKFIRITKTGDTGEARCGLLIGITALSGDGCSAGIKMRRITAGASGYAPYVDAYGGSGLSTANRYFSDANTPLGEWVDYAVSSGPGNALTGAATFYVWVESAIGSTVDFCFPQCNGGQKLSEYVPTYGDETVASAEALKFLNMDTLGLNQDAWTIIVEATEPASDPTPGYPMILRMTGPGGVVATINKQPDGLVEFQIYDGAVNIALKVAAGTPGTTRRYLLGFDRASQTMRCGATGTTIGDATGASLATVGPYTDVQIASADGFWWCNNITAKVEVVKRLLLKEECQQEIAL